MKKKETFIARCVGGQHVLMPVGKTATKFSGLVMTNDVGAFIWDHLEEAKDEQALAALIAEEFEVSEQEALSDTQGLTQSMRNAGWIE